jgi:hypothetical protein
VLEAEEAGYLQTYKRYSLELISPIIPEGVAQLRKDVVLLVLTAVLKIALIIGFNIYSYSIIEKINHHNR